MPLSLDQGQEHLWTGGFTVKLRQVIVNQPDIMGVNKLQKKAVGIDIVIPRQCNIRKEQMEKYQGFTEERSSYRVMPH